MFAYRYSEWDGTQEIPPLDADDVLENLTDDLMNFGDLQHALRNLLQRGMRNPTGQRMQGLRDLLQQLRQQRRQTLDKYNLSSVFDDLKRRLNEIVQMEKGSIQRRLEETLQGAGGGEGASGGGQGAAPVVAGAPPFGGSNPIDITLRRSEEDPPELTEPVPGIDPDLASLIPAPMARAPQARPPGAAVVAERIGDIVHVVAVGRQAANDGVDGHPALLQAIPGRSVLHGIRMRLDVPLNQGGVHGLGTGMGDTGFQVPWSFPQGRRPVLLSVTTESR